MKRLKSPMGLAVLIVIALSIGTATAATNLITGKDIKDHSITGKEIKRKSIPLSALRTLPTGQGAQGEKGPKGDPGEIGSEGGVGPTAFVEAFSLNHAIPDIAPSPDLEFLGEPPETVFFPGDHGSITVTATIGTSGAEIDDSEDFRVAICVGEEGDAEATLVSEEEEAEGEYGVSPTLPSGARVAVTVTSSVFLSLEAENPVQAQLGPCVLNKTASSLDENDRVAGSVLLAEG